MAIIIDNIKSEGYLSGNTLFANSATLTNLVVTNITGASTTDYYVTGGTYSSGTLTLKRNGLSDITISGFGTGGGGSGTLTGSGVTNKVAFWSGASGLTYNTNFSWDNTNQRLGVGITTPLAKLHVTNTGTTNSFLVEDSTSPDSTPFVIDQSGNVGIGTTTPTNLLEVNNGNLLVWRFATNPNIIQRRSNGSSGSESNVLSDEIIGYNNFQAFQSAGLWPNVARVGALAEANHTSSSMPTRLSFWTTPSGSTTVTERMRINKDGNVAIGTTTFDSTKPEKLVVYPSNQNAIVAKGPVAGFMQLNIQNTSNATNASSDVVATNNTGGDTNNYIDMGINSSTYVGGAIGVANDSYLYNIGRELYIGNATSTGTTGNINFFAGNLATSVILKLTYDQKINIPTTPALNNANTQILTRNSTTGNIEYSTAGGTTFYPYGIGFAQSIGNYLT